MPATRRPRALDLAAGRVRFERGDAPSYAAAVAAAGRAAVVAHYAAAPAISRSVAALVEQLCAGGYPVLLVSACEAGGPLRWPQDPPATATVLRKPNVGYDFGSWAVALREVPAIARAPRVILANDSMLGPFRPLDDVLARFAGCAADAYGLTDTHQFTPHLQSYFLGFRGGVLAEAPLRRFYADVRHEASKWEVIRRYELGLARLLRREGYGVTAVFPATSVVGDGANPVISGWAPLLHLGFPFVKRELLVNPEFAAQADAAAEAVRSRYGERLADWLA